MRKGRNRRLQGDLNSFQMITKLLSINLINNNYILKALKLLSNLNLLILFDHRSEIIL